MIVVTGGAGFIGSCLVKYLNELGFFDILIVDDIGTTQKWKNLLPLSFRDIINIDDLFDTWSKLPRLEYIFHLGAISSTTHADYDLVFKRNYQYTKKLCQLAVTARIKFVYASSAATYGDGSQGFSDQELGLVKLRPLNFYGYSKHMFDVYAQRYDLYNRYNIIGLKYFNIFGPHEDHKNTMSSVVFKLYHEFLDKGSVSLFKSYNPEYEDGEQKRDFCYVKDAVKMTYYLANHSQKLGGVFNIGSGQANSFNDIIKVLARALDTEIPVNFIDMPDNIKSKYQYYTKAQLDKLESTQDKNNQLPTMHSLEDAVSDYVKYLQTSELNIIR